MTEPRLIPSPWLEVSWIVAGFGLIAGIVGGVLAFSFGAVAFRVGLYVSAASSIGWIGMLLAALVIHRWRGLWLLVGSPAALFWPVAVGFFMWAFRNG